MCSPKAIADGFSRGASCYSQIAKIQHQIATDLLSVVPFNFEKCLDIGCGPGVNFKELKTKSSSVLGIDISEGMVDKANELSIPSCSAIISNIEATKFEDQTFDLIFSSYALQWCNLSSALSEIKRISTKDAFIAISIPINGTLFEFKEIMNEVNIPNRINSFPTEDELSANILAIFGNNCQITIKDYKDIHFSVKTYLASIRAIGANTKLEHSVKDAYAKDKESYVKEHISNNTPSSLSKTAYLYLMKNLNDQLKKNGKLIHTYKTAFITIHK